MSKYLNTDGIALGAKAENTSSIKNVMFNAQLKKEVLSKVSIPMYFEKVIVPQLDAFGYYDVYPVNFDSKPVVCCPLHDEDTPSCRYYPDTESFYCFGCRKGGTVINLHKYFSERMNGTKVEDGDAVDYLYDYFVKGKETTPLITVTSGKLNETVERSTEEQIRRFNSYKTQIENSLLIDASISLETKKQIWEWIDKLDLLVSTNDIGAIEAKNSIKDKIDELIISKQT